MTYKHYPNSDPFEDRYYLIKNGYYYRPDAKGYTSSIMEAGMFGEEWARDHVQSTEGVRMELAL